MNKSKFNNSALYRYMNNILRISTLDLYNRNFRNFRFKNMSGFSKAKQYIVDSVYYQLIRLEKWDELEGAQIEYGTWKIWDVVETSNQIELSLEFILTASNGDYTSDVKLIIKKYNGRWELVNVINRIIVD